MQSPLQEKEMKLQQFEYLAVSPYPPAEVRPSLSSPDAGLVLSPAPTAAAPSAPRPAAAPAVAPAKSKAAPAAVPQNELAEPDAVALLVSYDVILAEVCFRDFFTVTSSVFLCYLLCLHLDRGSGQDSGFEPRE